MFDGIEIDMLSLGDADSILVTQWTAYGPFRVLIDGGSANDAEAVKEFLRVRNANELYAVVCTHPHHDHARGLIKLVQDKAITILTAWMHDIRNHVSVDALRRASAGSSSQATGVREVVETTKELASAFYSRNLTPKEPFVGEIISSAPSLTVLGPSIPFYKSVLGEFTRVDIPIPRGLGTFAGLAGSSHPLSPQISSLAALSSRPPFPANLILALAPPPLPYPNLSSLLAPMGALRKSSVKENPTTQPFNNTSVIIGGIFNGNRLLFTADAGADALGRIPADWRNLTCMQIPHHGSDGNLSQTLIERFCPRFAYVSACGDTSHPSRAVVSGLVKVGSQVFSTHYPSPGGHLWFKIGNVPGRAGYSPAVSMRGSGNPIPVFGLASILSGARG